MSNNLYDLVHNIMAYKVKGKETHENKDKCEEKEEATDREDPACTFLSDASQSVLFLCINSFNPGVPFMGHRQTE